MGWLYLLLLRRQNSEGARCWNIGEYLPRIKCRVLAIEGFDDQYGTMAQLDAIAAKAGGPVETLRLRDCKHSPHRDQPTEVISAICQFLLEI
jgi:pimeloyl-ACP methyl ester carboxylesterase